jgi:hypothetical protein
MHDGIIVFRISCLACVYSIVNGFKIENEKDFDLLEGGGVRNLRFPKIWLPLVVWGRLTSPLTRWFPNNIS